MRSTRKRKWNATDMLRMFASHPALILESHWEPVVADLINVSQTGRIPTPLGSREVDGEMDIQATLDPKNLTIRNGVCLIPIEGVIVPRASDTEWYWGEATASESVAGAVRSAMANDSVTRIVAVIDSPGGSVYGLEEAASEIFAARGKKPMEAVVAGLCASAAYYLGSAFGQIFASPSSSIGSIGALLTHVSFKDYYEKLGIHVNHIHFGKHKVDASPYRNLDEQSKASLQESIDAYGKQFVEAVSRQRGISVSKVLSDYGQGKVFIASQAQKNGLIDGIATLEQRLAATTSDRTQAIAQLNGPIGGLAASIELAVTAAVTKTTATEATAAVTKNEPAESAAKTPATQTEKQDGVGSSNGGRTVKLSPKIKSALFALDMTDAQDASDEVCMAALKAFCKAKGVEVPTEEAAILSLLISESQSRANKPGSNGLESKGLMTREQFQATRDDVMACVELINGGREEALITSEDAEAAILSVQEGKSTLSQVQASWKNKLAKDNTRTPIAVSRDAEKAFSETCTNALLERAGYTPSAQVPNDVRSLSLLDMGEKMASFTGLRLSGDREDRARQLLQINPQEMSMSSVPYNRPGDFPNLLSNLAGKVLDQAIALADPTYPQWTTKLPDLPDFKPKTVMGVGAFDNLSELEDGKDPTQLAMTEELKGFIEAVEYGNWVALTPKMMADDDLDGFTQQLNSLAMAHEFKLNSACLALLFANPTLPDGVALFHATHSNLISSSPGAPSAAEAAKVRNMLRRQAGIGTTRTINVYPQWVLVPDNLEETAEQAYLSIAELVKRGGETKVAATDGTINVHRGRTEIICEPELYGNSTTAWYVGDRRFRTIVHAFQTGFGRGGKRTTWYDNMKRSRIVLLEGRFGAACVGWRGILKDPGA